jgi:hypothetical protein
MSSALDEFKKPIEHRAGALVDENRWRIFDSLLLLYALARIDGTISRSTGQA